MTATPGVVRRVRYSFESLGWRRAAIELVPTRRTHAAADDGEFDRRHGTTTGGRVDSAELGIADWMSRASAIAYLPSPTRVTTWMLDRVALDPSTTTFVDLGCGKGRVLLTAAQRPFRRVVGVEISTELAAVARRNVDRYRPPPALRAPIEIVESDVTEVDLPDGDLLVHLYHPFEPPITDIVVDRLTAARHDSLRRVTIAYLAFTEAIPRVREVFARSSWLHEDRYEQSVRGDYNWLLLSSE